MENEGRITIKKVFGHTWQILKHKYYVLLACIWFGIWWRGLKHDLSKFSPVEFWPSVRYYEKGSSPIPRLHEHHIYKPWLHHKAHNDHHSEYWHRYSSGNLYALKMSFNSVLEQLADWYGSSKAYGRELPTVEEEINWLKTNPFYTLHPETLQLIIDILHGWQNKNIDLKKLKKAYGKVK
jgi:hypothetical protein